MSGREERSGYDIDVKRSQVEMERNLIQRRESEARDLIPDIEQLLREGRMCGESLRHGFGVGKLYLSSRRAGSYLHGYNVVVVRHKVRFFSKPIVLMYEIRNDWEMAEIKMFESGVWTECLVEVKSLSAERLVEYEQKQDEIRTVAATQERRERLGELGIHLNEE